MSSNESLIKCENCRQDILADKMFLHEGFCKRNNVFCEHCERVFLKKDYKEHIIEISDILSSKNRESISKQIKTNSTNKDNDNNKITVNKNNKKNDNDNINDNNKTDIKNENKNTKDTNNNNKNNNNKKNDNNNKNDNIQKSPEIVNENPSINQEKCNWIEQYTINTPIIISPNGEIISKKNKNDFLLPILGFDGVRNSNHNYVNNDDVYLNQDYFFNVNNNVLNYDQSNYINNGNQINKSYIPNNIGVQNAFRPTYYNVPNYNLINQNNQHRNYNGKKIIKRKKKANKNSVLNRNIINNNDLSNIEFSSVTKIHSSNNNNKIFNEEKKNNDNFNFNHVEKNIPNNNNNIILNNDLNKFNTINNINQTSSIFINPIESTPQRINIYDTNTLNNTRKSFIISSKYKTTTEFNPIRVSKYRVKNIEENVTTHSTINNNNFNNFNDSPIRSKEPLDNTEKRDIRRKNFLFSPIEKKNIIEKEQKIINIKDNNMVISEENSKTLEQPYCENVSDSNDNEINNNKNIIRNLKPTFNTINSETITFRSNIMPNRANSQDKNIIKKKSFQTIEYNKTNNTNNTNNNKVKKKKYYLTSKKIIKKKPKFIKEYLFEESQNINHNNINQNQNMIKKMNSNPEINYKFSNITYDPKERSYENKENQLNKTDENPIKNNNFLFNN